MTERGTLMFQVLAVLAIMAMTAPMLMRQRARQIAEVERRTVEEQTSRIKRALKEYIAASAMQKTAELSQSGVVSKTTFTVPHAALKPYLPDGWFENDVIRPNRLVESYTLTVEASCVEIVRNRCVRYVFHGDCSFPQNHPKNYRQ